MTSKDTIRRFIRYMNNSEENGGFWLPNIQRTFVWSEEQIEKLFDSILREYPIGTFLVWKTKEPVKIRKFIDAYREGIKFSDLYIPEKKEQKLLVLDGQQRIQSLFIGLCGSYEGKELCIDILSGELVAPDEVKYKFKFLKSNETEPPWIRLKEIVFSKQEYNLISKGIIEKFKRSLTQKEEEKIATLISKIIRIFVSEENVIYQVADSVDKPELYTEDDVVEIFIRANSGGTPLSKSDLLFSLLMVEWDEAQKEIEELLENLNRTGYQFNRDFILKTALTLVGEGARYEVKKFRKPDAKKKVIENWEQIEDAMTDVKDFVYGNTFLKEDKTLPSYLALIPLIYFRYKYLPRWKTTDIKILQEYILRVSLTAAFSGTPDNLIDQITTNIDAMQDFKLSEIYTVIKNNGRNLEISSDTILNLKYGKNEIHLPFNLWYGFNYQPSYQGNQPQIDHIFPQSILKKIKIENPKTGRKDLRKYYKENIDQIGNLMLLTAVENGAGGKKDIPPEVWFSNKNYDYLKLHLIPEERELWKLDNFEKFVEERNKLIIEKFNYIIVKG